MLERIDNRKLNDMVFDKIKESIIGNILKPGEKLNIEELAQQLGVSRTPVSNAMKALEMDSYVVIYPQSGTFVRSLTEDEIAVIYDLREQIEGMVVRLAIAADSKDRLRHYLDQIKGFMSIDTFTNDDIHQFFDLELELHDYLSSLSPQVIRSEIRNIIDLTKRSRRLNLEYEMKQGELTHIKDEDISLHLQLIEAIYKGDVETAERLVKLDVRQAKEDILRNLYRADH